MERKFILLSMTLLLMKGCDGIQLCKQYSLMDSSSYTIYFCANYCCDSVYSRACCHDKPVSSSNSVRTWSMSKPLARHRRSSLGYSIAYIIKYAVIGYFCLILLGYFVNACKRQCGKNTVGVASSSRNQARATPGVTSTPGTTEEESTPTTPTTAAATGPTWQGERWRY